MASIAKALAANIARYRSAKGLSQSQLAELIGISRQTIWSYEKGEGRMNLETVAKLAEALGVEESDLVVDPAPAEGTPERLLATMKRNSESVQNNPPIPADILLQIENKEKRLREILQRQDNLFQQMEASIAAHESTGHAPLDPLLEQVRARMSEPAIREALNQILRTPPLATPEDADRELDRMLEEAHAEKAKKPPKKR